MMCDEEGKVNEAHCLKIILAMKGEIAKTKIQPNRLYKMSRDPVSILVIQHI
jgi:hypothetical protein